MRPLGILYAELVIGGSRVRLCIFLGFKAMASRVLVVEDDELQQDVLKSALEKSGDVVDVASDGLQAVHKLRTGQFDLALVDYHIPEVDGLASAKLLHEVMEKGTCPKLVAITADFSGLLARGGDKSSFDAIVQKPLDLTNVLTVVKDQLKGNTAEARLEAANAIWRDNGRLLHLWFPRRRERSCSFYNRCST